MTDKLVRLLDVTKKEERLLLEVERKEVLQVALYGKNRNEVSTIALFYWSQGKVKKVKLRSKMRTECEYNLAKMKHFLCLKKHKIEEKPDFEKLSSYLETNLKKEIHKFNTFNKETKFVKNMQKTRSRTLKKGGTF